MAEMAQSRRRSRSRSWLDLVFGCQARGSFGIYRILNTVSLKELGERLRTPPMGVEMIRCRYPTSGSRCSSTATTRARDAATIAAV
jgi:hypothetical protein